MNYNIHPIIVHFPIAFLFLYSIIKILPLNRFSDKINWVHIRILLIVVGMIGAWFSGITGEISEHLVQVNREVLNFHTLFAGTTNTFYGILLFGELLPVINIYVVRKFNNLYINKFFGFFNKIFSNQIILILMAIFGLLSLLMTGLLGGVMVYGTTADPIADPILKILGIN